MRLPTEVRSVSWRSRVFKPWLVASVCGLALGWALLSVDAPVAPSSYIEQVSRAAVYDQPFTTSTTTEPASTVAEGTFVPEPPLPALAGLVEGATSALPTELE